MSLEASLSIKSCPENSRAHGNGEGRAVLQTLGRFVTEPDTENRSGFLPEDVHTQLHLYPASPGVTVMHPYRTQ